MSDLAYTRYELLRAFRNKRFLFFSLGFPLMLYFLTAAPNKNTANLEKTGLSAPLYFMVSMASWGTMTAMLSTGARIAGERQVGWNRQLRISPLSAFSYLRAKVAIAYLMAALSLVTMYISGAALGVSLPARDWLEMTALIVIALVPFAAAGIFVGHKVTVESVGPAIGGGTAVLALVSGTWFPVTSGFLHDFGQILPSYWLVQAGRVALGGGAWNATGWMVVIGWSLVMTVLAARAYRNDTNRA
ncbi:MAG TPA: ABC transporter permease [Baekduia sp.]|uniref:ABC transporter permease n=1 Tax=Baekduia sp. TaxID=2600305 RepID=UPI002D766968|nr:ABC transporter permease [Baekduia sp.]HET6507236.1 ABC transporter permease [Baekduia sp.]